MRLPSDSWIAGSAPGDVRSAGGVIASLLGTLHGRANPYQIQSPWLLPTIPSRSPLTTMNIY